MGRLPPAGVSRLLIVVGGGVVVLQSSPELGAPKLIYLAFAGAAFLASCRAVWNLRRDRRPMYDAGRPWLIVSLLLVGLIGLSLPVALAHGTTLSNWFRDAATYGLFAAAPVFALDAAASMRRDLLLAITVAIGALAAVSHATHLVALRNIAIPPFDRLVLSTGSLPTALLTLSLATAILDGRHRLAWIMLGGLALAAFLVSGTRTNLLVLVALPAVLIAAGRPLRSQSLASAIGVGLIGVAVVVAAQVGFVNAARDAPPVAVPSAATSFGSPAVQSPVPALRTLDPNATILRRLQGLVASPGQDASLHERIGQYILAWEVFVANPVLGVGLGHPFVWTRLDGLLHTDFTADTPLVLPAKLGILGVAWVGLLAIVWVGFIRRLRQAAGVTIIGLAMSAWAVVLVVLAWTGFAVEDKGFSLAVTLVLALGLIEFEAGPAQANASVP